MSTEMGRGIGPPWDAFEDDLTIDLYRDGAGGEPGAARTYTKAGPPRAWIPCACRECRLGGFDLAHELGPLVFARQRAVAAGTAVRRVDERVRLCCAGRRAPHGACAESFTVHIAGTLRRLGDGPPAGEVRSLRVC